METFRSYTYLEHFGRLVIVSSTQVPFHVRRILGRALGIGAEEKKIIFSKFALPKVLKRIGLKENECIITEDGLDAVIEEFKNTSGIRDLEQAAEHLAANALYQIEVDHVPQVTFDAEGVRHLFL